ncbi:transposase [Stomatobaculum sp.]
MRETRELADAALKAAVRCILEQALRAVSETRQNPRDAFKDGRALAYYEVLDTVKNQLEIYDSDANDFGLGMNLDMLLSPR